jgi:hypothetical protein
LQSSFLKRMRAGFAVLIPEENEGGLQLAEANGLI